jgi:hypothetical protein
MERREGRGRSPPKHRPVGNAQPSSKSGERSRDNGLNRSNPARPKDAPRDATSNADRDHYRDRERDRNRDRDRSALKDRERDRDKDRGKSDHKLRDDRRPRSPVKYSSSALPPGVAMPTDTCTCHPRSTAHQHTHTHTHTHTLTISRSTTKRRDACTLPFALTRNQISACHTCSTTKPMHALVDQS